MDDEQAHHAQPAIVGGQLLSLLLALLIAPVSYSLFDSLGLYLRRITARLSHAAAPAHGGGN
jgi:hypothetical protein